MTAPLLSAARELPAVPRTQCGVPHCENPARYDLRITADRDGPLTVPFCEEHAQARLLCPPVASHTDASRATSRRLMDLLLDVFTAILCSGALGVVAFPLTVVAFRQAGALAPSWIADGFVRSADLAAAALIALILVLLVERIWEALAP